MQIQLTIIGAPYELLQNLEKAFTAEKLMDVTLTSASHDDVHVNRSLLDTDFSIHYIMSASSSFSKEILGPKNQSIYIFEAESQQSIQLDRLGFRIIYNPCDATELVEEVKFKISSTLKQGIVPTDTFVEDQPLIFSSAERYFMIEKDKLIRATSSGNYTTLHLRDQKQITVSKQLGKVLEMLPKEDFYRVHHSHVVNKNYILSVMKKNQPTVVLSDNMKVPVSRRKKKDFLLWLGLE